MNSGSAVPGHGTAWSSGRGLDSPRTVGQHTSGAGSHPACGCLMLQPWQIDAATESLFCPPGSEVKNLPNEAVNNLPKAVL